MRLKRSDVNTILKLCAQDNLASFDPYDIWKTRGGYFIKNGFNRSRLLYAAPALALILFDIFINNRFRLFYSKQEYPIVRALAALSLMNLHQKTALPEHLSRAENHLDWLIKNSSPNHKGMGWGLGFKWNISGDIVFSAHTPLSTHTPYALEALHKYFLITQNQDYLDFIYRVYDFYEQDIQVVYAQKNKTAVSYGPIGDIVVTNATAYTLFAYSIFYRNFPDRSAEISDKMKGFYNFIREVQQNDGSWLYAPFEKSSFIDCFHSAFIVKNLIKAKENIDFGLDAIDSTIQKGYDSIIDNFFIKKRSLFKRFSLSNKPSLIKFDLYDNAEMLNLALLMGDTALVQKLDAAIKTNFCKGDNIYSMIDILGLRKNKNTLRWAVMPYLYSLSNLNNM